MFFRLWCLGLLVCLSIERCHTKWHYWKSVSKFSMTFVMYNTAMSALEYQMVKRLHHSLTHMWTKVICVMWGHNWTETTGPVSSTGMHKALWRKHYCIAICMCLRGYMDTFVELFNFHQNFHNFCGLIFFFYKSKCCKKCTKTMNLCTNNF